MATLKELLELTPGRKVNVSFSRQPEFFMYIGSIDVIENDQLEFDFMGEDDVYICIHDLYEDKHAICKPIEVEIFPEREKMYV